jgi:hypothetical protein
MKRIIAILLAGGIAGGVLGFATGIFIYPFWFLTDVAHERLDPGTQRTRLADGSFVQVNPSDPVHWGTGMVSLYEEGGVRTLVHLHDDFEVGPGPRFHVYLVDHPAVMSGADFTASQKVDLGRLRAFKGSQVYAVPADVDAGAYQSVVVWCKEFGVLISPASLTRQTAGLEQHR